MRLFVFSDVHGEYEALLDSLNMAGYDRHNPNHKLISIGDNFDRGERSYDVFRFLRDNNAICIKGNHETFLEEALEKGMDGEYVLFNLLHNGLDKTIQSFSGYRLEGYLSANEIDKCIQLAKGKGILDWIKSMPLYYETKNYIFVHAGLDPNLNNWKDTSEKFMLWDIENSALPLRNVGYKRVVIGHHHAFRVRQQAQEKGLMETSNNMKWYGCTDENRPVKIDNKIAIDACSNYTHKVNVLVIDDDLIDTNIKTNENTNINGQSVFVRASDDWQRVDFNTTVYTTTARDNIFTTYNGNTWL